MPTYRIFYTENRPQNTYQSYGGSNVRIDPESVESWSTESEWEEEVEGRTPAEALEAFFREHNVGRGDVKWVDADGQTHDIGGIDDFDPDKTYIWIEGDKLMEFEGIAEATPGMVTCPLCGGDGEVEEAVAEEFLADEEEDEGVTWG